MKKVIVGLIACGIIGFGSQNSHATLILNEATGHYYGLVDAYSGTFGDVESQTRSWEIAEENAVDAGGHLVTINDEAENAWLVTAFGGDIDTACFIGLYQEAGSTELGGGWHWASGESVTYLNWNLDNPNGIEPNDADGMENGGEQFGSMYTANSTSWDAGSWNDVPIKTKTDNMYRFGIMEYDADSVPDGGMTMTLLGLGMAGLGMLRRKLS